MLTLQINLENVHLVRLIGAALTEYAVSAGPFVGEGPAPVPTVKTPAETPVPAEVLPPTSTPPGPAEVDQHGVPFDMDYCAVAKEPFYKNGQWKKKRGLGKGEYDLWYAAQLLELPAAPEPEPEPVNTAAAFSNEPAPVDATPADAGALMLWVSSQQAAGNITQTDLDAAYAKVGFDVTALFAGTPEELAQRTEALYMALT